MGKDKGMAEKYHMALLHTKKYQHENYDLSSDYQHNGR
jgi:hypothetical protein